MAMAMPNAFISLRINERQIIDRARQVQEEIKASHPLLSPASTSISKLHITLMVFRLQNDDEKQKAKRCLFEACQAIRNAQIPPTNISFSGISHFKHQVLYIDAIHDEHLDNLKRIADICRTTFENNQMTSSSNKEFAPHITLFKLSKLTSNQRRKLRKIDTASFEQYKTIPFGNQNVQSLQICNMLKNQSDGYYEILHEEELK